MRGTGRDAERALAAALRPRHALVPALDHVPLAEREDERVAAVLARIELPAPGALVEEPAGVVHRNLLARRCGVAGAERELVDHQPACRLCHGNSFRV